MKTKRSLITIAIGIILLSSPIVYHLVFESLFVSHQIHSFSGQIRIPARTLEVPEIEEYNSLKNLIMVAGHAVFNGNSYDQQSLANEQLWTLESFQHGHTPAFLAHIQAGVELASRDPSALLLFSGGETRKESGPISEAQNYWKIADANGWFSGENTELRRRALTEEFSRDSFENLLFSICRFREITQRYPENITVISFSFKRARFQNIHAVALRFPQERFHFEGVDPPGMNQVDKVGEISNAAGPFMNDPYGCSNRILVEKRLQRNPFRRIHSYPLGCPEIAPLFSLCDSKVYTGTLPWD
uniref:DUF218 domain-containing protein n=1 Tax=Timspurckia oligopyrenoides TaxID=708627 RepID=A0A6T6N489_9RHOD|mmetsp:Transcript_5940/g.10549  ORF Transcript_5940/g.10549 Transcript_5940/m.10549 type:complete len:301 (+) Transcript_5940:1-903(+)